VLVVLKDDSSKILDSETLPLVSQGTNGVGAKYISVKGTCHNGTSSPNDGGVTIFDGTNTVTLNVDSINADTVAGTRRGLALVTINRNTLAVSTKQFYDTYYSSARCDALATAINNVTSSYFVCLFSNDAIGWTDNLVDALRACGSIGIDHRETTKRPFAFIGYRGLPECHAMQMLGEVESSTPAEVMAYVADGKLTTSLDGKDSVRYFLEVNPSALVKTSGNSWVSSGNITVHAYKQKGDQEPIAAVQGDVYCRYIKSDGGSGLISLSNGTGTISINNLSAYITYLTVFLSHSNSDSSTRLDSVTIPVIANGAQGYEGCQVRTTKWEDTSDNDAYRVAFQNDRGTNKAFKVVDVIAVPWKDGIRDLNGNVVSYRPTSGYLWYVCKTAHTQRKTWEIERVQCKDYWEAMSDPGPMFISLLVAQYGKIEFGTTNEFIVVNSRNEVVAGFSGLINTEDEDNSIRIWAGKSLPTETWNTYVPTRVAGKYLWGRVQIKYGTAASSTDIRYYMPTMLCDSATYYYTVNTYYQYQPVTVENAPQSGWVYWDKNAELVPSERPTGYYLWIKAVVLSNSSGSVISTFYFRVRVSSQNIYSFRMNFVNSDRQGSEPSIAPFRVTQAGAPI